MNEPAPALAGRAAAAVRHTVTGVVFVIALLAFAFGFGNGWALSLHLGVSAWIAPLVAPAVDLSVVALLVSMQYIRASGVTAALTAPRLLLLFCGLATLALNIAEPLLGGEYGRACLDAVAPALLLGWSEVGPRLLAALYLPTRTVPTAGVVPVVPSTTLGTKDGTRYGSEDELLAAARVADAAYRAAHGGKPITRDALRSALGVGSQRATAVLRRLRAEAADASSTIPQHPKS